MSPDAPKPLGPVKVPEPTETVDQFLDRVEKEFQQVEEHIEKAAKEGEWLQNEPEM